MRQWYFYLSDHLVNFLALLVPGLDNTVKGCCPDRIITIGNLSRNFFEGCGWRWLTYTDTVIVNQ